jgi:hypothetical protein
MSRAADSGPHDASGPPRAAHRWSNEGQEHNVTIPIRRPKPAGREDCQHDEEWPKHMAVWVAAYFHHSVRRQPSWPARLALAFFGMMDVFLLVALLAGMIGGWLMPWKRPWRLVVSLLFGVLFASAVEKAWQILRRRG